MFRKIEDILKIYNITNFELTEQNRLKENKLAIRKYKEVLEIFNKIENQAYQDKDIADKQRGLISYQIKII